MTSGLVRAHHAEPPPCVAFVCIVFLSLLAWLLVRGHLPWAAWSLLLLSGLLAGIRLRDVRQTRHAILRNYPILAHLRFFFEYIRPEIRQYFIESEREAVPFSRAARSLVYQRAKRDYDKRPFGTQIEVYAPEHEWINHSIQPAPVADPDFRVLIGASTARPYSASLFNISAMSFGSLSANAILALNEGARRGGFAHDTGEGRFDPARFAEQAVLPQVKMIEVPSLAALYKFLRPGELLGEALPNHRVFAYYWPRARAERFELS